MDEVTSGMGSSCWNAIWDPLQPWWRPGTPKDLRWFPEKGGGRRLRHPFLDPIVYPRVPDRTVNVGYDVLRRTRTATFQTMTGLASAKFPDPTDGVVIQEVWVARQLSTFTDFFHELMAYWDSVLPPGAYVGWQPKDRTWKNYFVEILDVVCGPPDEFQIEELGDERPYLMREQLTLTFRTIREVVHPTGEMVGVGA